MSNPKEYVEKILKEIESSRNTRLWEDSIHMLGIISESIFSRSAHFILELLQNAEDAGSKIGAGVGEIGFSVSPVRIKITHNGQPFNEEDVNAICGVRSSKKPEQGTLGFLGIGFKSVFKITDCPRIYSAGYQFKFDKARWSDPRNEPWQIMPLWVEQPPEAVDPALTTFILPFRSNELCQQTVEELRKLDVHIFLFLKWLKKLHICDEITGKTTVIENVGGQGNVVSLMKDGVARRFAIFRRVSQVPMEVANDPALEFYKRQNVNQREVVLAFGVDDQDNLMSLEDASALGSISSFLPLVEERSGAKFLIQSDFLVQPGREAIQYELAWNHWLISEAAEAAKDAIEEFKKHPKWGSQFIPIFKFQEYKGQAAFDKLFNPKLHQPIADFLSRGEVCRTIQGPYVKPDQAVLLETGLDGLLSDSDLPHLFSGRTDLRLADPSLNGDFNIIPLMVWFQMHKLKVSLEAVARNKPLLEQKLQQKNHVPWFVNLCEAMVQTEQQFRTESRPGRGGRYTSYDSPIFVLTDKNTLMSANTVYLRDIPNDVLQLRKRFKEVDTLLNSYQMIHPKLATPQFIKFFKERTHVQGIDYGKICREVFLPKLNIGTQAPPKDELVAYTRLLQKGPPISEQIWVITQKGNVKPSNQVFFGSAYSPAENWEKNATYTPQIDFLSDEYLQGVPQAEVPAWKDFLTRLGGKERADNPYVEQFAMAFVEDRLRSELTNFIPKDRQQHGYDREATRISDGAIVYLEIKGQKTDHAVELKGNEPAAAQQAQQNKRPFWVCVVRAIPENPELWVVEDPLAAGQYDVVTIDVSQWKTSGRRVI